MAGDGRVRNRGQTPDVVSAGPCSAKALTVWRTVAALLAGALVGAVLLATHYRSEAASLRPAAAPVHPRIDPVALSTVMAALPPAGRLAGAVMAVIADRASGQAQVIVTAQITGGHAHARYELSGGDCAGHVPDHVWAASTTSMGGSATLTGHAQPVQLSQEYYFLLTGPGIAQGQLGPGVHGWFSATRGLAAVGDGQAPCAP
jgi:hypothetical protein